MFKINKYYTGQNITYKEKQSLNILKTEYQYLHTNRITDEILDIYPKSGIDLNNLAGKRVLDVGAGTSGTFINHLRTLGVLADGIDLHVDPFINYIQKGDAQMLPYKGDTFNVVFSTWSLFTFVCENLKIKNNVLKEVFRVLKPNGKFLCAPVQIDKFQNLIHNSGLENDFIITKSKITDSFFNRGWCELTKFK